MVKPRLLVALAAALSLAGCGEGTVSSARFVDSVSGVQLEYTLKSAHAYLAEYYRTVRVVFARSQVNFPMEMDTGGYLMLNIHRLPDQRLMLFDGAAHILIDPQRETVIHTNPPSDAAAAEYVGCFDWPQNGAFAFIAAADRPEQKPLMSGTP